LMAKQAEVRMRASAARIHTVLAVSPTFTRNVSPNGRISLYA
jgi:hypothetical protein